MTPRHSTRAPVRRRSLTLGSAFAIFGILPGAAILAVATHGGQAAAAPAPATPGAVPVSVAVVAQSDVIPWDEYSGRLEAIDHVEVRARVSGAVLSVHFREGALVKAGDLLVTIDPAPYAAEVARAQAQELAAEARLTHARIEQQRSQRLLEDHAVAQRDVDDHDDALREADADLHAAQASLTSARLNLDYTQVRAPIGGRVGKFDVTVGNLVAAGPTAPVLTTLVSVNPIYATFDVDERVILNALQDVPGAFGDRSRIDRIPVRMGTVTSDGTPYQGRLQLIDNQVDASSGTIRVRARFDNGQGQLIPGQFARLWLGRAKSSALLLVAERAIGTDQSRRFVMVVGSDNKASYREVTLGPSVDGLRSVSAGLQPGERVVVDGLQRVKPGALVAPHPVSMKAPLEAAAPATKQS